MSEAVLVSLTLATLFYHPGPPWLPTAWISNTSNFQFKQTLTFQEVITPILKDGRSYTIQVEFRNRRRNIFRKRRSEYWLDPAVRDNDNEFFRPDQVPLSTTSIGHFSNYYGIANPPYQYSNNKTILQAKLYPDEYLSITIHGPEPNKEKLELIAREVMGKASSQFLVPDPSTKVNGQYVANMKNQRTGSAFVSLTDIAKAYGYSYNWNPKTLTADISKNNVTLTFPLASQEMIRGNQRITIEWPTLLHQNTPYIAHTTIPLIRNPHLHPGDLYLHIQDDVDDRPSLADTPTALTFDERYDR